MTLFDWIPAFVLAAAIGLVGFLFRQSLLAWLTSKIAHHFDREIEQIRSDLRARESQIQILTQDALSGASSRRSLLYQRRLQAIECLWTDISALAALRYASMMLAVVNVEEVAKRIEKEPALQRFFGTIAQPSDIQNLPKLLADKERPFISDNIWKLYTVYRGLLFYAVTQIKVFQIGLDPRKYTTTSKLNEQIKAAVPAFAEFVDKFGPAAYDSLIDPVADQLLIEVRAALESQTLDDKAAFDAAAIVQKATQHMKSKKDGA